MDNDYGKDTSDILSFYTSDEYVSKSDLDTSSDGGPHIRWKVDQVLPAVFSAVELLKKKKISLLDIGGGTGLALKLISSALSDNHSVSVSKYAADLSPAFLEMQINNNPDIVRALNEDVRHTSLEDKQIDISIMIDVLEHVPNPEEALVELSRISRFTVFKQPLEDNLLLNTYNLLTRDRQKRKGIETVGHINFYNFSSFKKSIESCGGKSN